MAYGTWYQTLPGVMLTSSSEGSDVTTNGIDTFVYKSRSGYRTPGYRRLKKYQLHPLPYSFTSLIIKSGRGDWRESYVDHLGREHFTHYTGCQEPRLGYAAGVFTFATPEQKEDLEANLTNKFLEKIKDQKVNLAQVFAERKLTADLIAENAKRIASAFLQLKKGNIRAAAKTLGASISRRKTRAFNRQYPVNWWDAVCNGWLELRYGWMPLLQDIYGSAELLAQKQARERHVYASVKAELKTQRDWIYFDGFTPWIKVLHESLGIYQARMFGDFESENAALQPLSQMGLTNPLSVAWEVLPWSFVLDWAFPLGAYLNALDAPLGLRWLKGGITRCDRSNSSATFYSEPGTYSGITYAISVRGSQKLIQISREIFSDFPRARFPVFKNPFSFIHAANAVALLSQVFQPKR